MSRSRSLLLWFLVCAIGAVTLGVSAQNVRRAADGTPGTPATLQPAPHGATRAIGTIQYDNDTPFQRDASTDTSVGNRFTPTTDPHTITSVSFRLAQNYGVSVNASIWDQNAASAVILQRFLVNGLPATNVTGTVFSAPLPTPITSHTGPFLGGIHNTAYTGFGCPTNTALNGTCDGVALTAGTTATSINGIRVQLAGGAFTPPTLTVSTTAIQDLTANAIFRVTGDNLPVELMSFGIDED